MKVPFVDLKAQYLSIKEEIDGAIQSVIDGDLFVAGKAVTQFEREFANYLNIGHCIGCANGTDALEIALKALGIGPGDEVLVPALTWISTAGAVSNLGAEPVFVDVLPGERTMDPAQIREKITGKTKAVIPVHLYGLPARMIEILQIADNHNLFVIEDCAQAHGAAINGQKVGTFGDIATFSFYPSKNLGAYGDGGAIVTNDGGLAEKCRKIGNHGQQEKHDHSFIGRNSRLDSIQAAVLSVKLKYLDEWNTKRIQLAQTYSKHLRDVTLAVIPEGYEHVFHLYVVESKDRESLKKQLNELGIETSIHYSKALPFIEAYQYQSHRPGDFPVAEQLCDEVLSLPIFAELKKDKLEKLLTTPRF
ncbi:MAG: DegT/DnrJ/EryC1/StrS family aminotransferase [Cyclobacteriaceae bacterium]